MLRRAAVHLAAMHLSGAMLLLTFLVPPAWALDAYAAAPVDNPSADGVPFADRAELGLRRNSKHRSRTRGDRSRLRA
ncbi:hypothetical protein PYK79_22290 [Streptomyces sp. ID05-04B]|nr:hypothetical protein [Streptomyces sp. ID05-04B]